jgi:hypothetical protein
MVQLAVIVAVTLRLLVAVPAKALPVAKMSMQASVNTLAFIVFVFKARSPYSTLVRYLFFFCPPHEQPKTSALRTRDLVVYHEPRPAHVSLGVEGRNFASTIQSGTTNGNCVSFCVVLG